MSTVFLDGFVFDRHVVIQIFFLSVCYCSIKNTTSLLEKKQSVNAWILLCVLYTDVLSFFNATHPLPAAGDWKSCLWYVYCWQGTERGSRERRQPHYVDAAADEAGNGRISQGEWSCFGGLCNATL
jgi:hypothetical protein